MDCSAPLRTDDEILNAAESALIIGALLTLLGSLALLTSGF